MKFFAKFFAIVVISGEVVAITVKWFCLTKFNAGFAQKLQVSLYFWN